MKKQALLEMLGSMPAIKSMSITKITVKKKKPNIDDKSEPGEDMQTAEPAKERMEQTAVCPMKTASDNHLLDAYFEGFVKECEARGVDSEELVAILLSQGV